MVVQLGAGLDARYERMGRPKVTAWYDLDLPEVIDVRRMLLPESSNHYLGVSMFDESWTDTVAAHGKPVLLVIEGVLMYFDEAQVQAFLKEIEAKGGEGVMLRNPNTPYHGGRSSNLLKLKSQYDAECTVTRHHEGKGKYAGKLGAVSCKNQHGEFRIGSGFKDADRDNPPPVGSVITYRYRGFTQKGTPRFATFLRVRKD